MLVKPGGLSSVGECSGNDMSCKMARNGRWYCVRKARSVSSPECETCDRRPRSMFFRERDDL